MKARKALALIGAAIVGAPGLGGCNGSVVTSSPSPSSSPTWPVMPSPTPTSASQPPAIGGGTLTILRDGHTAVASDPDQDAVWFVDLDAQRVVGRVALSPGDEPGRVVEDAAGRVHVALRRGGALATIDPSGGAVTRRAVCAAPRGLAYDPAADAIHVACADGVLATLPAAGGAATRTLHLDADLRDVVVQGTSLFVSRFRAAEILEVASDGSVVQRITLPSTSAFGGPDGGLVNAVPGVAYRMVGVPSGGLAVLHQRALDAPLDTTPGGYAGGMCPGAGVVSNAVTFVTPGSAPPVAPALGMTTLGVDLALSPDGSAVAVGAASVQGPGAGAMLYATSALQQEPPQPEPGPEACLLPMLGPNGAGQVVAVAFDAQGRLVSQTRDPAGVVVAGTTIPLPSVPGSVGLSTFYTVTKAGIACASCHPEAGDDGRVWQFVGLGARRTQNLRGGVLARAPFHWSGEIADMDVLAKVVFEGRMVGPTLDADQIAALGAWMNAQPALAAPTPADASAVTRGSAIFRDPAVGCTTCHDGQELSNHQIVNVGTGGAFKVPSLVAVGYRAPYMHDGCAATLLDRFAPSCGGGDHHGHTSQLTPAQLSDLVSYLESL